MTSFSMNLLFIGAQSHLVLFYRDVLPFTSPTLRKVLIEYGIFGIETILG